MTTGQPDPGESIADRLIREAIEAGEFNRQCVAGIGPGGGYLRRATATSEAIPHATTISRWSMSHRDGSRNSARRIGRHPPTQPGTNLKTRRLDQLLDVRVFIPTLSILLRPEVVVVGLGGRCRERSFGHRSTAPPSVDPSARLRGRLEVLREEHDVDHPDVWLVVPHHHVIGVAEGLFDDLMVRIFDRHDVPTR